MRPECAHHTSIPAYVRGRRCSCHPVYHPFRNFNSRPYVRGDYTVEYIVGYIFDFNSRPCTRGDGLAGHARSGRAISIHSPARGATRGSGAHLHDIAISIHAPARGATHHPRQAVFAQHISIHAPTRGATALELPLEALIPYFNSRPYARGDQLLGCGCGGSIFQFTPLREGRHEVRQPLPRADISIHAPTRGATAKDMRLKQIFCSILTNHPTPAGASCNLQGSFW